MLGKRIVLSAALGLAGLLAIPAYAQQSHRHDNRNWGWQDQDHDRNDRDRDDRDRDRDHDEEALEKRLGEPVHAPNVRRDGRPG